MGKVFNKRTNRWEDVATGAPVAAPAPNTTFAKEAVPATGLTLPGGATSTAGAALSKPTAASQVLNPPPRPTSPVAATGTAKVSAPTTNAVGTNSSAPASSAPAAGNTPSTTASTASPAPSLPTFPGFDKPLAATPGSTLTMFGPQGAVPIPTGSSVSAMPGNRALLSTGNQSQVIGGSGNPNAGFEKSRTVGADGTTHIVGANGGTVDIPAPIAPPAPGAPTGIFNAGQEIVRNSQGTLAPGSTPAAPAAPVSAAPTAMAAAGNPTLPTPNFAPVPTSSTPQPLAPDPKAFTGSSFALNTGSPIPAPIAPPDALASAASRPIGSAVPVMASSDFAAPASGTGPSAGTQAGQAARTGLGNLVTSAGNVAQRAQDAFTRSADNTGDAVRGFLGVGSGSAPAAPGTPPASAAPATNAAATGSLSSSTPAATTPAAQPAATSPGLSGTGTNLLGTAAGGSNIGGQSSFTLQSTATAKPLSSNTSTTVPATPPAAAPGPLDPPPLLARPAATSPAGFQNPALSGYASNAVTPSAAAPLGPLNFGGSASPSAGTTGAAPASKPTPVDPNFASGAGSLNSNEPGVMAPVPKIPAPGVDPAAQAAADEARRRAAAAGSQKVAANP